MVGTNAKNFPKMRIVSKYQLFAKTLIVMKRFHQLPITNFIDHKFIWYLKHWSIFEDVKRISQWFCDCESISYLKWENIRKSAKEACFETYFWEISPKYGFFSTSYLTVVTYKSIFTATKIQVITLLVPSLMPGKSISHLGCNFALVSRFTAWEKDLELLYKCRICKWQYISCNKMQATFPSANRCIIPWQMRM